MSGLPEMLQRIYDYFINTDNIKIIKNFAADIISQLSAYLQKLNLYDVFLISIAIFLMLLCFILLFIRKNIRKFAEAHLSMTAEGFKSIEKITSTQTEISERQLRAYVDVIGISFRRFAAGQDIIVQVEVRNHGLTPALNLLARTHLAILTFPATDLPDVDTAPSDIMTLGLAARESCMMVRHLDIQKAPGIAERLLSGELGFYVVGRISYNDVFGLSHVTSFNMVSTGDRARGRQPFVRCETGNQMS